jgi:hypothetical protein
MRAFLRALLAPRAPEFRAQLDAFRDAQVDGDQPITAPRVVYATPERDESKPACVHLYGDADEQAAEMKAAQAKVTTFKARGKK